jgi:predicted glycoside hydrolase/deacetylase ChbG (UPF0249 family)
MSALRSIAVCADDFAFDRAVSDGILALVAAGRLSAVSCMTDAPLWAELGPKLRDGADNVALGVHFNLIERFGHDERPLAVWILRALTGTIDAAAVRADLKRQIERFVAVIGRLPDYVDGHQHVHAFPGVRAVVAETVTALRPQRAVRVRAVDKFFGRTDAPLKRRVIGWLARLGTPALAPSLRMNTAFGGDYSLTTAVDYAALFADWVRSAPDGALIMCHPAAASATGGLATGPAELAFLLSDRFAELLATSGATLARGSQPFPV